MELVLKNYWTQVQLYRLKIPITDLTTACTFDQHREIPRIEGKGKKL